jgi:hypothetical protein
MPLAVVDRVMIVSRTASLLDGADIASISIRSSVGTPQRFLPLITDTAFNRTFIYTEARNFYAANQYLATQVTSLLNSATQQASRTHTLTVLNQAAAGVDGGVNYLTTADPSALTYAFGYNEHNLQPLNQLAGEAATTAGAIYLVRLFPETRERR